MKERTSDEHRDYNYCYIVDGDGEAWLKNECAQCSHCDLIDSCPEAVCTARKLCEHG